MRIPIVTMTTTLLLALGCAGSYPPPTQKMADVQSANRSANELGAQNNPKAQLHLKLSEEQLELAKAAVKDDDNEVADSLLTRAKADAELAIALTRETAAATEASKAAQRSNAQSSTNAAQGVLQ
jgi:hypothetical protein